jgi:hypothetical protein
MPKNCASVLPLRLHPGFCISVYGDVFEEGRAQPLPVSREGVWLPVFRSRRDASTGEALPPRPEDRTERMAHVPLASLLFLTFGNMARASPENRRRRERASAQRARCYAPLPAMTAA